MPEIFRPRSKTLKDFAGRDCTVSSHPGNWRELGMADGNDVLLLGTGPGDWHRLPFLRGAGRVFWLEEKRTLELLGQFPCLPGWQRVDRAAALKLAGSCSVFFYSPGMKIAPGFWGPFLGELDARRLSGTISPETADCRSAWLPGTGRQLLHHELHSALVNLGYARIYDATIPGDEPEKLAQAWHGRVPDLALCVNFRGLDPEGRLFHFCRSLGLKPAIWLVDNPWHILAGLRLPWWRDAALFVTDRTFIQPLIAAGAKNVTYCPLAVAPHMWRSCADPASGPVFVGRSAFPDKEKFFRGLSLPPGLVALAMEKLTASAGNLPDYHWWLEVTGAAPWPGKAGRMAGLGAEEMSAVNRARWIKAALPTGLDVTGDSGWQNFVPGLQPKPPVDYYGKLPEIYAGAEFVLNVTSLLLPGSLNQRHFDVWAAGGFLLTDYTPGLEIFPDELVRPIVVESPGQIVRLAEYYRHNPQQRLFLQAGWRKILRSHTYEERIRQICSAAGLQDKAQ